MTYICSRLLRPSVPPAAHESYQCESTSPVAAVSQAENGRYDIREGDGTVDGSDSRSDSSVETFSNAAGSPSAEAAESGLTQALLAIAEVAHGCLPTQVGAGSRS